MPFNLEVSDADLAIMALNTSDPEGTLTGGAESQVAAGIEAARAQTGAWRRATIAADRAGKDIDDTRAIVEAGLAEGLFKTAEQRGAEQLAEMQLRREAMEAHPAPSPATDEGTAP